MDFGTPAFPSPLFIFDPVEFFPRTRLRWIGHHIPRADARWMGGLLSQLSASQIRDAFRAGGYSAGEIEGFAVIVESRIAALKAL